MTLQRDDVHELFGLAGTFPRPGWVVLDAARDHRFTGELRFETSPPVHVFVDRGVIYLAERLTDPSLGARLVDAGALTAAQLEHGAVRIGDVEHLGRLFDRVPTLDRHTIIVTAELMTEECLRWLAAQRVRDVVSTPYRHHESAMHLWTRSARPADLVAGDPLPAPRLDDEPVSTARPGDVATRRELRAEPFLDGLIEWQEPAWFDSGRLEQELVRPVEPALDVRSVAESLAASLTAAPAGDAPTPVDAPPSDVPGDEPSTTEPERSDWIDRLATDGLPEQDALLPPRQLPRLGLEPVDRFELVWPSGEVDEAFGAVDSVADAGHDPDADRIGATARLGRTGHVVEPATRSDAPAGGDTVVSVDQLSDEGEQSDEIVLAVRRAVASIEVGSLVARQRLAAVNPVRSAPRTVEEPVAPAGVPEPGRVAVRSGRNDWSRRTVTRSVFDEPADEPEPLEPTAATPTESDEHRERRAGALRRLISSLRR